MGSPASGTRWTGEQVLALAPDERSARAARALVDPRRWSELGSTPSLVWGRCQGSGRDPYQVTVDLDEPAFRCTCPSRKFPCKHGLALLLLWATGEGAVADAGAAADVAGAWAGERAERRRAAATPSPRAAAPDPAASAKRQALMSAGLDELETWLSDLVRQGLAAARRQPFAYWDAAAARLVDAQVPGLADRVRAAGGAVPTRPDWAEHLLAEAGRWYLAVRAWRRRDGLAPAVVADLRTVLGWPRRTEEVLAGERVRDRWVVAGLRQDVEPRLSSQRTWLWGRDSRQLVVVLDFAAAGAALRAPHVLGSVVDAEVALYPGSPPQRALFTGDQAVVATGGGLDGATAGTVAGALARVTGWLAGNPWLGRAPLALRGVTAVAGEGGASVVDGDGGALPLAPEADVWALLALSGGRPVDLFGEWSDDGLFPCSVAVATGAPGGLAGLRSEGEGSGPAPARPAPRRAAGASGGGGTGVWEELVGAALVGTERRRFEVGRLAGVVEPGQVDAEGAEAAVLAAAAVLGTWRRAGRRPDRSGVVVPEAAAPDDRPEAPPVAVQVAELLLDGHVSVAGGNTGILAEWLAACASSGHRAPARLVVPLLRLATVAADLRPLVGGAAGPLAAWLGARNPAWSWAAPAVPDGGPAVEDRFVTAARTERLALLAAVRASDPARALALVASTWAAEAAAERAALLEALGPRLGEAEGDEAFLEAALDDRAASVRAAAARLLDRLPSSRRATRMAARALPLVRVEGRVRRRLEVSLPDEPDAAARRDGVDDRAPAGIGRRGWWLVQLVGATPLGRWDAHLGAGPADAVRLAAGEDALLTGWARAAVAQGDRPWAAALAARRPVAEVVAVLDAPAAAAVVGDALRAGTVPDATLRDVLAACAPPWSEPFSRQVVLACRVAARRTPPAARAALGVLARRLHPGALTAVEEWLAEDGDTGPFRYDVRSVAHALTLRRTISEELR